MALDSLPWPHPGARRAKGIGISGSQAERDNSGRGKTLLLPALQEPKS